MTQGRVHRQASGESEERQPIPFVPLAFDPKDFDRSALAIVTSIRPSWPADGVELKRFTDGLTNTLLKASVRASPGCENTAGKQEDADREAVLLRAYGDGTDVLIDRSREAHNHELLARHGLAPELLARFENGMLYHFLQGTPATPDDLRRPDVYRAVARRLAEWHARVPCIPGPTGLPEGARLVGEIEKATRGKISPNVWTVMQKWILALDKDSPQRRELQAELGEMLQLLRELSQKDGLGIDGLVFAHCDLLSGNVIILPKTEDASATEVHFIDFEYATPSPAAFDIANHFAEWGGFNCDFAVLPKRAQRRDFVEEYVRAYLVACGLGSAAEDGLVDEGWEKDVQAEINRLMAEVDLFRGVPGFFWGIWALIQATISGKDFDYASYAKVRLGEYRDWKAEVQGTRQMNGDQVPLREKTWAQAE